MRNQLSKSEVHGELLDMMYMAATEKSAKDKVMQVGEISFRAFCFLRKSKRTFTIDNVLALVPVITKESLVI